MCNLIGSVENDNVHSDVSSWLEWMKIAGVQIVENPDDMTYAFRHTDGSLRPFSMERAHADVAYREEFRNWAID